MQRLIFRPFTEADYDDLYEILFQLRDDEFEGYPGITYENDREHLMYCLGSEEFFGIEEKQTGRVIGNIYCASRDYHAKEVGCIIHKFYQRQGFALEALTAVITACFSGGVHRIYAECDPRNTASWKLLEKTGLKREAHFRQNIYFHQDENGQPVWKDNFVYDMLKEESTEREK